MPEGAFTSIDLHVLEALYLGSGSRETIRTCVDYYERIALSDDEITGALDRLSRAACACGEEGDWRIAPSLVAEMSKTARERPSVRTKWLARRLGLAPGR